MNPLLVEGITDAVGFLAGSLVGFGITNLLGLDIFSAGYGNASVAGIVIVGIAGGVGLQAARKWRAGRKRSE